VFQLKQTNRRNIQKEVDKNEYSLATLKVSAGFFLIILHLLLSSLYFSGEREREPRGKEIMRSLL
jgi:hypothetical protein